MEPRLQFARTADEVAIAYWSVGSGHPLVHLPFLPWSHVQLEWQNPETHSWYETLAADTTLVRYDARGTGLSDRVEDDLGLEAQVRDIEAVVDDLDLERFVLMGVFHSGAAAIAYAARHPERVSGLVLWCTYARGADYNALPRVQSIRDLIEDWELYTETAAHAFIGWSSGETAHEIAAIMREAVTQDVARRFFDAMSDVDCLDLLSQVQAPTLVVHPRRFPLIDVAMARQLAAGIPGAHLLVVDGESLAPTRGSPGDVLAAIRDLVKTAAGEDNLKTALEVPTPAVTGSAIERAAAYGLTERELEVLQLVALGRSSREVADQLVISHRTVERHIANIYGKVKVNNRSQLTAFALSNGLAIA